MGQALGCIQVDQSTVAIKETFGKFDDVLEPGCHCLPWCLGSQIAGQLSLRVQQLDVRCETKTKVCCTNHHHLMKISFKLFLNFIAITFFMFFPNYLDVWEGHTIALEPYNIKMIGYETLFFGM